MQYPVNEINIRQTYSSSHKAVDLGWTDSVGENQPVYAVARGEIIYVYKQPKGGWVIRIYHKEINCITEYAHLKDNSIKVKVGTKILEGEQIAKMGATGQVSGPHLHFAMVKGSKYITSKRIDPLKYIARYPWQHVASQSKAKDKIYSTKTAKGIPSEPLLVHSKPDYNKSTVVKDFKIYNNTYIPYFGYIKSFAIVDNLNKYYTCKRFLF